ncbi:hypothetical protein KHS38_04925 [Mucilaginibacter sp. Bleaf8]|uniref:hypothetical protein n=1 Tax=Mucilaginibacter sp. Bleaf8 TaxID=2834430 RepID=UPI001BCC8D58|nr:hypothetical protein [Mucilaginibacter sp. Bleaf8]MBS7563738.1 hypothetical protein [Mucilaginibacter sp. Bleaf8]
MMKSLSTSSRFRSTIKNTAFLILAIAACGNAYAQKEEPKRINIGLVYPVSTNGINAAQVSNSFSLNLLAGLSKNESGAAIAGFSNVILGNAQGLQVAGFSNHIGKEAQGAAIAGFLNTYGSSNGISIAGFANIGHTASKAQVAGFLNTGGKVSGLQVAGFMNVAQNVKGSQVAGFINHAANVKGFQLAGFINHAKTVHGTQLAGFINIADTADVQIGVLNFSKNGEMSIAATIDEVQTALVSFRSGGRLMYGILGAGYNFNNKKQVYAYQAGLGAHLLNGSQFRLNGELTNTGLLNFKDNEYYKVSFALMPAVRLGGVAEIFAGPSINYINSDPGEGPALHKKYISSWGGRNGNNFQGFYVGYTAGVAFKL